MTAHQTVLHNWQQADGTIRKLADWLKPRLMAGHRYTLAVGEEKRNEDQSRRFHALCGDLARAKVPCFGKPRSKDDWKVILVSGHAVATKDGAEVIVGLEGELINLRESTARMGKARMSSLIEYAQAFAAQHGVELREPA